MKTLSISDMQFSSGLSAEQDRIDGVRRAVVTFSDGNVYRAAIINGKSGWDCTLRLLSSQRTVTSQLRRRMVLEHLGLESAVTRLEKSHAGLLRIKLKKYGYELQKSRVFRHPHAADYGKYRVIDYHGETVLGHWFSATLEQVEEFLAASVSRGRPR